MYLIPICYVHRLLNASPFYLIVLFVMCHWVVPPLQGLNTLNRFISEEIALNE